MGKGSCCRGRDVLDEAHAQGLRIALHQDIPGSAGAILSRDSALLAQITHLVIDQSSNVSAKIA